MTSALADAIALRDQGRYAEAEARLGKHLASQPEDRAAYNELNRIRLLQGRFAPPRTVEDTIHCARSLSALLGAPALQGADEGARLQAAAELVLGVVDRVPDVLKPSAARILRRAAQYEAEDSLGSLTEIGRLAARQGEASALLHQSTRVETDADRLKLLHQHRLWAEPLERRAAENPIARPRRADEGVLRLGFLSSDLRHHVVAFFVQPLFQFRDFRFELYAYSTFQGPPDAVQQWFVQRATAFRHLPADDREAAEVIAADDLDMLIELGGPTSQSRPGILAYKPARLQASWLGYPHSLGLSAIDHFIADPQLAPARRELLLEEPLLMPATWICMAPAAFQPEPAEEPLPPVARTGRITFGSANDPYKYTPRLIRTWARVVSAVPGSRFMFVRPEAGAACFQDGVARLFAEQGVARERLEFRAVRGPVRRHYADIDIALDTFPLTGGTTTCDALWMGVPTVTLVGPALYERLSFSILTSAGLPELIAATPDDYVRIAVELAGQPGLLAELRSTMRGRIQQSPLGQPLPFAAAFFNLVAEAIRARA